MTSNRIDGWKAVGQYLGRERTTVIRWARTRDLPIHRVPGGKKASVYAFRDELDAWIEGAGAGAAAEGEANASADGLPVFNTEAADRQARPAHFRRWWILAAALAAAGFLLAITASTRGAWESEPVNASSMRLPRDPATARLYLQAREDWALRSPEGLRRAIAALTEVVRQQPDFALAYSGLADSYLLAREFGTLRDAEAFARARRAAEQALRLDSTQAAAFRAIGFVNYWWDRDRVAAGAALRRAIALDPDSAQTHFWYGNILSDNGEHGAALRELDIARAIEPGSMAIQSDLAYAYWASGETAEGIARLERLVATAPDFAGVHSCLADVRLAERDLAGFVREYAIVARLRQEPRRLAMAAEFATALDKGAAALRTALLAGARRDIESEELSDHVWPVFVASVLGRRDDVIRLLHIADARKETWGTAALTSRIKARWKRDGEIEGLLKRRTAPAVEPG